MKQRRGRGRRDAEERWGGKRRVEERREVQNSLDVVHHRCSRDVIFPDEIVKC